jgi:hypothetical protein
LHQHFAGQHLVTRHGEHAAHAVHGPHDLFLECVSPNLHCAVRFLDAHEPLVVV